MELLVLSVQARVLGWTAAAVVCWCLYLGIDPLVSARRGVILALIAMLVVGSLTRLVLKTVLPVLVPPPQADGPQPE